MNKLRNFWFINPYLKGTNIDLGFLKGKVDGFYVFSTEMALEIFRKLMIQKLPAIQAGKNMNY